MLLKIIISFLIVEVTFSPKKLRSFFEIVATFYISSFIFAGAGLTFIYLNQSIGYTKNGIFHIINNSQSILLVYSLIGVSIILKCFFDIFRGKFLKGQYLIPLKVAIDQNIVCLSGFLDTGNSLIDPLTKTPVIIAEFDAIRLLLPAEIQNIYNKNKEDDLISNISNIISTNSSFSSRIRLIPFNTLGKENGLLLGFTPDFIEIGNKKDEKKNIKNAIIGIYSKSLSKSSHYNAILNPELCY